MITFCIPIFEQHVTPLVDDLIDMCEHEAIPFQILCFDDGSSQLIRGLHAELGHKSNVNYTELDTNHGRARIRNKMAKLARFDYLVFLDCDSGILSKSFVANYLEVLADHPVVYGGRVYEQAPNDKSTKLHWLYGSRVESQSLRKRLKNPNESFLSNNFAVHAKVMSKYGFDEEIQGYGYEDLAWANTLAKAGIQVHHIHNPVCHLSLDKNNSFIAKTERGIQNLITLRMKDAVPKTKLVKTADFLMRFFTAEHLAAWGKGYFEKVRKRLIAGKSGVFMLQIYKLWYYFSQMKEYSKI